MKKLVILLFMCMSMVCHADPLDNVVDGYFGTGEKKPVFFDLDSVPWATEAVTYLAENNAVSVGIDGSFRPNDYITREEFIKVLIITFGVYDSNATSDFTDTKESDWHYSYVSTAKSLGITNGVSDELFGIGRTIERQEMAALIYRMITLYNSDIDSPSSSSFNDSDKINEYAKEAVALLSSEGIINGDPDNNFNPSSYATRAEACKMIYQTAKKYLINI